MSKPWNPRLTDPRRHDRRRWSPDRLRRVREWLPSLATVALGGTLVVAYHAVPRPAAVTAEGGTIVEDVWAVRVIDGDTIDYGGQRIRIADINTPETGRPLCASEARLGAEATRRMEELIALGPVTLSPAADGRDEDVYGRKLRIVERDGRSLGSTLVEEGLAHEWRGYKQSWCAG
jgi:endonuclease YncB( thermonuclease family)